MNIKKTVSVIITVVFFLTMTPFVKLSADEEKDFRIWDFTVDTSWYDSEEQILHIYTAAELAGLSTLVNNGKSMEGKEIKLENDLILNRYGWKPIGLFSDDNRSTEKPFSGVFDGNNHSIDGLSNSLFGFSNGEIKNLNLTNVNINVLNANQDVRGVVASYCSGKIYNCTTDGTMEFVGTGTCSGICAYGFGEIEIRRCRSSVNISLTFKGGSLFGIVCGGICGYIKDPDYSNDKPIINECCNYGDLVESTATSGLSRFGGICGCSSKRFSILNSYNRGNITGVGSELSGIGVFYDDCIKELSNVYNTGIIKLNYNSSTDSKLLFGICNDHNTMKVSNAYYLSESAPYGTNATNDQAVAKNKNNMMKESFSEQLGPYFVYKEGDYPVLAWEIDPTVVITPTMTTSAQTTTTTTTTTTTSTTTTSTYLITTSCCGTYISAKTVSASYNGDEKEFDRSQIQEVVICEIYREGYTDNFGVTLLLSEHSKKIKDITMDVDFGSQTPSNVYQQGTLRSEYKISLYFNGNILKNRNGEPFEATAFIGPQNRVSLWPGETYTIKNNRNGAIYESKNNNIATVSSNGIVKAVNSGTTIVSITDVESNVNQIIITVYSVPTTETATSTTSTTATNLTTTRIKTTTTPPKTTTTTVYLTSNNKSTAIVSDVNLTTSINTTTSLILESGKFGENIRFELDQSGTLTFMGTGAMYDRCYASWNRDSESKNRIKNVIIKYGITSIGHSAFYQCSNLESISIPDSIVSIGENAFYECTKLERIIIPDSVKQIGGRAFYKTSWLVNKQKENPIVIVNDNLIDGTAYTGTDIIIPNYVTSICGYAFMSQSDLTSVTIPNNVTSIGDSAFNSCSSLESVIIPDSVKYIGWNTFYGTPWLEKKQKENPLVVVNNILIDGKQFTSSEVVIPDNVISISAGAFYYSQLLSVVIPDSVGYIGDHAFYECRNLQSVSILSYDTYIGTCSFNFCSNLLSIKGYTGSTAESYAKDNNIKFEIIEKDNINTGTSTIATQTRNTFTTISTTATTYAKPSLTTTTKNNDQQQVKYNLGDIDNDGEINAVDASKALAYYALLSTNGIGNYNEWQKLAADVNHDGLINAVDASNILSYYAYVSTAKGNTISMEEFMNNSKSQVNVTTTITTSHLIQTTISTTTSNISSNHLTEEQVRDMYDTHNTKCLFCGFEFMISGVSVHGIRCPNCNKYFMPTDINPTEKDILYASKYPGIWHTVSTNEHELTIHVINSKMVSFSIWYYRLWKLEYQDAYFEGNRAYFTSLSDGVSGYLTFEDDTIKLTITKSNIEWIKENTTEEYTIKDLNSIEYGKQYTDNDQLNYERITRISAITGEKASYVNEHYLGVWRILKTEDEELIIHSIDENNLAFTLKYGDLHTFYCDNAKIEGNKAEFVAYDGPYDVIAGYIIFNNYLISDDIITVYITMADAPGVGSNTEVSYHK